MRVLHIMGRMAPGGTEHQLVEMLLAARQGLWEPTLCVLSRGWELSERARSGGVELVELEGAAKPDLRRIAAFRALLPAHDVVHSSLWGANAFARIAQPSRQRMPTVVSERGVESHRRPWQRWADRGLRHRTDAYVGNSQAVTSFISTWHGLAPDDPRIFRIENGVDTDIFHPPADAARTGRRIVVVGRLVPGKRVERLIGLMPQLADRGGAELVVIGDGPQRSALEAEAAGLPVRFLGHIAERARVADELRGASVLAMPSASEGLPNAVIEALSCGTRVVASDIPGIRPLAGPGLTLVGEDDANWEAALADALKAPRLTPSETGLQTRSFDQVAKGHLAAFEYAVEHRGRAPS